jgi:hypothetical protein
MHGGYAVKRNGVSSDDGGYVVKRNGVSSDDGVWLAQGVLSLARDGLCDDVVRNGRVVMCRDG